MFRTCFLLRHLMIGLGLLVALGASLLILQEAIAAEHPILYFFWGEGCPHCEKEKEFLSRLQEKYPELEMRWFETWKHREFTQLADTMRKAYDIKTSSVPMTFLGDWNHVGFSSLLCYSRGRMRDFSCLTKLCCKRNGTCTSSIQEGIWD